MGIDFAKFFRALSGLFGGGKSTPVKPPLPTIPAPPRQCTVAFVTFNNGRPVPNAAISLNVTATSVVSGSTNGDGYLAFVVPASLLSSTVIVDAAGFEHVFQHLDLPGENKEIRIELTHHGVDPSTISLRELARVRGAMWTVRGPWAFGPRPGSPDNITAMEFIYSYTEDVQKQMIAKYKSYGYTHVAFGPINAQSYHGQYPDTSFTSPEMFEKWLDYLQMFWDNGLAPICFLHPDNGSLQDTKDMYDHLIRGNDRAQRLMRIIVPSGWEPTQYGWSSKTWASFFQWGHDVLPNALILAHTVTDVDAMVGTDALFNDDDKAVNPGGNASGWARVCPYIHGWLTQSAAFDTPDAHGDANHPDKTNFDNWQALFAKNVRGSYYDRFHNGYAGWPKVSLWGNEPIKIYAGEYAAYWSYWNNRPYAESVKWGDAAIAAGADGYFDGGSVDVP